MKRPLLDSHVSDDKITVLRIACECLNYFKVLAEYRPPLGQTRMDANAMKASLQTRTKK